MLLAVRSRYMYAKVRQALTHAYARSGTECMQGENNALESHLQCTRIPLPLAVGYVTRVGKP